MPPSPLIQGSITVSAKDGRDRGVDRVAAADQGRGPDLGRHPALAGDDPVAPGDGVTGHLAAEREGTLHRCSSLLTMVIVPF